MYSSPGCKSWSLLGKEPRALVEDVNGLPIWSERPSNDSFPSGDVVSAELTRRPLETAECVARFHICGSLLRANDEGMVPSVGCAFM